MSFVFRESALEYKIFQDIKKQNQTKPCHTAVLQTTSAWDGKTVLELYNCLP